jgi:hypothetical protein
MLLSTSKMAVFWVVARSSETLVNFYQTTRRYNPEDSHLRTNRREKHKTYLLSTRYRVLHENSKQPVCFRYTALVFLP